MNFTNIFREASAALRRNWVRSILTIVGISVGVGAFICVVAIGNAGSSRIESQLQSLGDNFIWIEAGSRARNGVRYGARGDRTLILGHATTQIFKDAHDYEAPNVAVHRSYLVVVYLPGESRAATPIRFCD